ADPAALGGNRNFSAAAPSIRDFREELVRVDYAFSSRHTFYTRLIFDTIPSTEPFGLFTQAAFPGISDTKTDNPGRSVVSTWNWTMTPTMTNELSYNYSRGALLSKITGPSQRDVSIPKIFSGVPGDDILPGIAFGSGNYGGFNFFGPYDNTYGSHRLKETVTRTAGAHALKGGFLYSFEFKNENSAGGTNGSFVFPGTSSSSYTSTGDALADFLLGRASSYGESRIDLTSHLRFQMYEAFVQDDWRILPNLTLNLGARWSYILQPYDADNVLTNFDPAQFDPARAYQLDNDGNRIPGTGDPLNGIVIAGQNSPYGRRVVASHANTIGPRAGFAWDPRGDGKTAIRAGYGMYFDRTLVGIALQNAFVNPPFAFTAVVNAAGPAVPTLQNPRAGAARDPEAPVPNLIAMSPGFKIPTTHQYSIGIQRELPFGFNADVAYVGTQGRNLLRALALNQTPPGTAAPLNRARPYRGWGNITFRSTEASSEYNSLQVSLFRRLQAGFQIGVNYTLSKVVTDASSDRNLPDIPQDINNLAAERALATYDRPHIFGAHYVWELPFFRNSDTLMYNLIGGWQLTGSTRIMSGLPLTITATGNTANSFGGGAPRPDLVGDPEGPRTVQQWFNTDAFKLQAANTFGNAPRSVVRGPGTFVTDLGIFKNFRATDGIRMQFRAELFNAFNHTNFVGVGTTLGLPTFGRLTSSAEARVIQFGLKLTF
ncbi:MAG: hypothetical protein H0W18_14180, partial [Acidobacteria bacterium]|nr:hypothetical protein [Acidobacteriota bacterium]